MIDFCAVDLRTQSCAAHRLGFSLGLKQVGRLGFSLGLKQVGSPYAVSHAEHINFFLGFKQNTVIILQYSAPTPSIKIRKWEKKKIIKVRWLLYESSEQDRVMVIA